MKYCKKTFRGSKMKQNKNKKLSKLIIVGLLSFTSVTMYGVANADDNIVVVNKKMNGSLKEIGEKDNSSYHTKQLKGFAKDLPLITVMKQITPNGWVVKKQDTEDNKLDINKNVSWVGGKTWIETLHEVASNYSLDVTVNWDNKTITIGNYVKKELEKETKKGLFVLEGSVEAKKISDVAVGASEQNSVQSVTEPAPVAQAPANTQQYWAISSSHSLRDNVQKWAEKAGYRLVWTGEDYSVEDAQILAGSFDEENGPIKQLSVDYGPESRVQVPLSFQFYQNRTLVVENWLFEQSGYPQYNKKD